LNAPKPAIFQRIMLEPLSLNLKNIFHEQLVFFSLLALDFPVIRNHSSPKTCCHLRTHLHIHHHIHHHFEQLVTSLKPLPQCLQRCQQPIFNLILQNLDQG
jgi:hypothetical protein